VSRDPKEKVDVGLMKKIIARRTLGVTEVDLRLVSRRESLIANVITNSMLVGEWDDVTIAITNEGGIRCSPDRNRDLLS